MRNIQPREIEVYETPNGQVPFTEWFASIQDTKTQTRIRGRLDRLENGNYGDCQSVGSGVFELRLHFGPGIASTLVKWIEQSSFYSVAGINQHRHGTSNAQKPIG